MTTSLLLVLWKIGILIDWPTLLVAYCVEI